tara:strand:+ start:5346 stop:6299 length:954 start_codon:yes stop_codon:yes gene_type:complete
MDSFLDFEKDISDLNGKIKELRHLVSSGDTNVAEELVRLEASAAQLLRQTYDKLTPWQKAQVARHPERPHFSDYARVLLSEFTPLAGDRTYAEDAAILGGLGRFEGRTVVAIGHEKGEGTEGRVDHNFGMAHPEGYRKAVRLFELADRFGIPVLTFIDTPGAYPGVEAEERGQAEAIARAIETCLGIDVPVISIIIGEGGSGGAIALGVADRILMLGYAIYSVISPEGCASILWRSSERSRDAAEMLRMTSQDMLELGIIDEAVEEPIGGAHRFPEETIELVGRSIGRHLLELEGEGRSSDRRVKRRQKFIDMGTSL